MKNKEATNVKGLLVSILQNGIGAEEVNGIYVAKHQQQPAEISDLLDSILANGVGTDELNAIYRELDKLGWEEILPDDRKHPEAHAA